MGSGLKQIYAEGLSTVYTSTESTTNKDYILEWAGSLRFDEDGKTYRFVQNDNASNAFLLGQPVCYQMGNAGVALLKNVKDAATADLSLFAGVAVGLIPAGGYGWIQVSGYNAAIQVDSPVTATMVIGSAVYPTDGVTYIGEGGAADTAPATAPAYPAHVQILELVATVTTGATSTVQGLIFGTAFPR